MRFKRIKFFGYLKNERNFTIKTIKEQIYVIKKSYFLISLQKYSDLMKFDAQKYEKE